MIFGWVVVEIWRLEVAASKGAHFVEIHTSAIFCANSNKCTLQVPGNFFANSALNKKLKKRPSVTLSEMPCRTWNIYVVL